MSSPSDEPGVPLASYRSFGPEMAVEFRCSDCQAHFDVGLEAVISRLQARGVGGPDTGVREVARYVEKPCERCGGKRFTTRPWFPMGPNTPSSHSA